MAVKERIYIVYNDLFIEFHNYYEKSNDNKGYHKTEVGKKIVNLFRTKLGYSKTTFNGDILWCAYLNWRRFQNSGVASYNSRKNESQRKVKGKN